MTDVISHDELPPDAHEPATKGDIYELRKHFDAAVEIIRDELRGANTDEISTLKDADNKLHQRIVPLEKRAGIQSPEHEPHPFGQA